MNHINCDSVVNEVVERLLDTLEKYNFSRFNSVLLLKALFEVEDSPLYDAIVDQVGPAVFPNMLEGMVSFFPDEMHDENEEDKEFEQNEEDKEFEQNEENKEFEQNEENKEFEQNEMNDDEDLLCRFSYKGKENTLKCDDELAEFLLCMYLATEEGKSLTISTITRLLVYTMPHDTLLLFRMFGINIKKLKKFFGVDISDIEEAAEFQIPSKLSGFVRNLNEELKGQICDISCRDRECELAWQTMLKHTKRNVVLIGEPGVGKTSIVIKMVHDILQGTCPAEFKDFYVLSLDVGASVAGTKFRGEAEERYTILVNFLRTHPNVILFIDEIHTINGAGACQEGGIDLANILKPILAGGEVRTIGATTKREYDKYLSRDGALKRRFRPVYVKEPKANEVYPMLKKSIETLSNYHDISISKDMVDFIILNASCFNNETCNPDRTKDLIDLSMVAAKAKGKKKVDKKDVLSNFAYHLKKFAKMSDHTKRSTAYHEAGHCLVAICSNKLVDYDVIAVSIMPTDSYQGVTVYEYNNTTPEPTLEYLVEQMAMDLAGRVAEKIFTSTITAGARSDLANATSTAYNIVTKYGMWEEFGINRIYTEEISSDKAKDQTNEAIDKLISKAMERAEEILTANRELLEALVEALMKNGIVGPKELKNLFKGVKKI